MAKHIVFATLLVVAASPLAAQTPAQVEAEPLVKLQPGETVVEGQCLTRQELDLVAGLNALSRPTVGPEGVKTLEEGDGDDVRPFDPHYFVGTWEIDGPVPESALGESGDMVGTETVRHLGGLRVREHHRSKDRRHHPHRDVADVLRPTVEVPRAARGRQPGRAAAQGRSHGRRPGRFLLSPLGSASSHQSRHAGALDGADLHHVAVCIPGPDADFRRRWSVHQLRNGLVGTSGGRAVARTPIIPP